VVSFRTASRGLRIGLTGPRCIHRTFAPRFRRICGRSLRGSLGNSLRSSTQGRCADIRSARGQAHTWETYRDHCECHEPLWLSGFSRGAVEADPGRAFETQEFQLPLIMRVGTSMDVYQTENNSLKIGLDAVVPNDNEQYINIGAEYIFNNFLALRAGYKSLFLEDSEEGLTLGFGIKSSVFGENKIQLDYAYGDFGVLEDIQEFAISFTF